VLRAGTMVTSTLLVLLGVAIVVRTVALGGGALALGLIMGVLFCAAGAGRLYLTLRRDA
jgi:hypothetical protein